MRKFLAILCAVMMLFALTACSMTPAGDTGEENA